MKEAEKKRTSETVVFRHETFSTLHEFLIAFFNLPIFKRSIDDESKELELATEAYRSIETKIINTTNLGIEEYALYDYVKIKFSKLDNEMNQIFDTIRKSKFVPESLNHPVWEKPLRELKGIEFERTPNRKLDALVKCLTAVSRACMLLSEQSDEVTADDILQYSSFVFIKSGIKNIAGYIKFIK